MPTDLREQCRADGFARGLLKCAINPGAAESLIDAARVMVAPGSRRTAEAFGRDLFEHATNTAKPVSSFMHMLLGRHPQVNVIAATLNRFNNAIAKASPARRPIIEAARDRLLSRQYAELGTTSAEPIRFMHKAVPAVAAGGAAGALGVTGGDILGRRQQSDEDASAMGDLPIYKRMQYALFPQSIFPKPESKSTYDIDANQTS